MGIDIYMKWRQQTEDEYANQFMGFEVSGRAGSAGKLTTAAPMPQRHECWEQEQHKDRLPFSAATLHERLLAAIDAVRHRLVYNTDDSSDTIEASTEFVELVERKEKEIGEPVTIYASY